MKNNNEDSYLRLIYIRHADKEYSNGDANIYKHDPGITETGVKNAKLVCNHLIEQYGIPILVLVSPYKRTRETAETMLSQIDKIDKKKIMFIDTELSEYLGNHRNVPIDVHDKTRIYNPPHPETFAQMKTRVKSHQNKIQVYSSYKKTGVVWVITHGLIMKQIAKLNGINISKEFPPLTCLSIIKDNDIIKGEVLT